MHLRDDAEAKLQEYIPVIREHAQRMLQKGGQSVDSYGAEKLFGEIHSALPMAVRLVVRKKRFVEFCVSQQQHILSESAS